MPEEGFLRRWARMKATGEAGSDAAPAEAKRPGPPAAAPAPATVPEPVQAAPVGELAAGPAPAAPTLEDAARLTPASDFSAFVSQGVDKDVRRLALKKLFADPHFKVLDRLDMYMDDYNKPDPVSATMLAALEHARGVLRRPEEVQAELARLAARDRPADAAARALEAELSEVQDVEEQAAAAGEQAAPGTAPDEPAADMPVRSDPASGAAPMPQPLPALPIEPAVDTIALPSLGAHNAEARP
ncbi:DUF3306 domain-containing protein [Massilia litorea]|uniref:DUF3306 domain-containing protein n=1 Tax=Massilia litorea TaxID=2769491 RepID=A0A7L9TZZ6_9BURK|nr:DUF3306 domain-containing protein [Massilia litorea]QOL48268.1 DUF3306 domain-containing protein [Massilia litorea]